VPSPGSAYVESDDVSRPDHAKQKDNQRWAIGLLAQGQNCVQRKSHIKKAKDGDRRIAHHVFNGRTKGADDQQHQGQNAENELGVTQKFKIELGGAFAYESRQPVGAGNSAQIGKKPAGKERQDGHQYHNPRRIGPTFLHQANVFPGSQRRHQGYEQRE
jgi:hypothetical protein